MKDPREGRGMEGFNKHKFDEGYIRAFGLCRNVECPRRYNCFRYLKTPEFSNTYYIEVEPDKCNYFVPDQVDK